MGQTGIRSCEIFRPTICVPTNDRSGMEHPLDNPVGHALTGPHARFAVGRGRARHYDRDVAPFSAIAEATPTAYADLAAGLPAGTEARLYHLGPEPRPQGWV